MADVFGTQQTKINAVPMKMGDAHSMGGRMRILSDTYTVPATGSTFTLVSTGDKQFKLRILTPYTNGRTSMLIYKHLYRRSLKKHQV